MSRIFTRRRLLTAAVSVAVIAVTSVAVAYFTGSGTGTGTAKVGSSASWTVTQLTSTGLMYPGAGTTTITYQVTNAGGGNQELGGTTATVASSAGNVTQGGTPVAGCLAAWFSAANTAPTPIDLAAGASASGSVAVTMSDAAVTQDVCKNVTPDITISAN